jgi:DnaK suppressor protein
VPSEPAPLPSGQVGGAVARLAASRTATLDRLERLTAQFDEVVAASVGSNADDEHDPEGTTIAFERSQLAALVQQARADLAELDAAAERVSARTYGVCEQCGGRIPAERLEARPTARTCVGCSAG